MSPHLTPAERHDHPAHAGTAITLDRDHGIVQRYRARIAARRRARLISRRNRRAIARWLRRTAAHTQPLHPPRPPPRNAAAPPRRRRPRRPARDRRDARTRTRPRPGQRRGATRPARQRLRQPALRRRFTSQSYGRRWTTCVPDSRQARPGSRRSRKPGNEERASSQPRGPIARAGQSRQDARDEPPAELAKRPPTSPPVLNPC